MASRVKDLPVFIEQANHYREMTGEGFTFLNIPRSYYGRLTLKSMVDYTGATADVCEKAFNGMVKNNLMDVTGVVKLNITDAEIAGAVSSLVGELVDKFIFIIKRSRYANLYKLLRDHLSESSYLKIVRNKVLVTFKEATCCTRFLPQIYCNVKRAKKHRFWSLFNGYARRKRTKMARKIN